MTAEILPRAHPATLPISAADANRMLTDHLIGLRSRTVLSLGPNSSFHRGAVAAHARVAAALLGAGTSGLDEAAASLQIMDRAALLPGTRFAAPLTERRCHALAEALLYRAADLKDALGGRPDRVRTPEEFFTAGELEVLLPAALRFSVRTAAGYARPVAEYVARVLKVMDEGLTDADAIFAEIWQDSIWG